MRSYLFEPAGERLEYALFVPRKIGKSKQPAALIVALHALNTGPVMLVNDLATTADRLAYIAAVSQLQAVCCERPRYQ